MKKSKMNKKPMSKSPGALEELFKGTKSIVIPFDPTRRDDDDALVAEDPTLMPSEIGMEDFVRLTRKLALRTKRPEGLSVGEVDLWLRAVLLGRLPGRFLRITRAVGHERISSDGTFEIVEKIPRAVMVEALLKAGIFKKLGSESDSRKLK